MTGVVIDITTGKEILDAGSREGVAENTTSSDSVIEIDAPDGRKIFSIVRLLNEDSGESIAA